MFGLVLDVSLKQSKLFRKKSEYNTRFPSLFLLLLFEKNYLPSLIHRETFATFKSLKFVEETSRSTDKRLNGLDNLTVRKNHFESQHTVSGGNP